MPSYVYRSDDGKPLYRVVRSDRAKRFSLERYDDGGWQKGIEGVERVPYNLPAVADAAQHRKVVYITEGEADADALTAQGVIATTNPLGAGKWRDEYSYALMGIRYAVICWDNDEQDARTGKYAGQEHALEVERSLRTVGVPLRFKRAKVGKDVRDHLEAGHSIDELVDERPGEPLPLATEPTNASTTNGAPTLPAVLQLAVRKLEDHAAALGLPAPRPWDDGRVGWEACCPAHDDRNPSLSIKLGDKHPVVVECHAGCTYDDVARALGISPRDFSQRRPDDDDADFERELQRARIRERVKETIAADKLRKGYVVPATTLADDLKQERKPQTFTIDRLHITGGNTLLVANYKAGKTTIVDNVAKALVDHEPFLGEYSTAFARRVGILQYELTAEQSLRWLEDLGIENAEAVCMWQLRGYRLPFWLASARDDVVQWCRDYDIGFLVIDTVSRAWQGLVESEGDNIAIVKFFDTIDEIKEAAGVDDCLATMHTPRVRMRPGEERARAASGSEAWMDHGWYLTMDGSGTRSLRAIGRDVDIPAIDLQYDLDTRRYTYSGVARAERQQHEYMLHVVDALAILKEQGKYPAQTGQLTNALTGVAGDRRSKVVDQAVSEGYVGRESGRGKSKFHTLTDKGRVLHERKVLRNR